MRSLEDIAVYNGFDQLTMTGGGDPERVRGGLPALRAAQTDPRTALSEG
ncbi:MAG TPA: hypothetical protein VF756_03735 [Thermoanaerobaculia bacterium]